MEDSSPLKGFTFLNTRDARSAQALTDLLAEQGAHVLEFPTIELAPPTSWKPFDSRLARITQDDWIVFTSANAVRATLDRLWDLNRPPATLSLARLAAIGRGTATALEGEKLKVTLTPPVFQQEVLLEALLSNLRRGDKVWIPRAQKARGLLVSGLRAEGYEVTVTPVYRTVLPKTDLSPALEELRSGGVDWILFTSTSTVNHFFNLLGGGGLHLLGARQPRIACIGAVTAEAARERGLTVSVVPARQDLNGMVTAIVEHLRPASSESAPA